MKEVEYTVNGGPYVPIERWGKDHWSTFAFLECRAVDHKGRIDSRKMRCNPRLHRHFAHDLPVCDGSNYPTRLRDGELENHDDWSCLEDMVAAGLLRSWFTPKVGQAFGGYKARVEFTATGLLIAAALRAHKTRGGKFSDFKAASPIPSDSEGQRD